MTSELDAFFDPGIVGPAALESLRKLDPRRMARNPVMFVVEVGSALVTVLFRSGDPEASSPALVAVWLWFTVLFANFAEAMAEGRGKAQAATLRGRARRRSRAGACRTATSRRSRARRCRSATWSSSPPAR